MLKVGDIVLAKVTGIFKYGFFVKVNDYVGLCHISEISNAFVNDIEEYVKLNDEIYVLILDIDSRNKRLKVSIKDINYLSNNNAILKETRKGFLPLKEMMPKWIDIKISEYKKDKTNNN